MWYMDLRQLSSSLHQLPVTNVQTCMVCSIVCNYSNHVFVLSSLVIQIILSLLLITFTKCSD